MFLFVLVSYGVAGPCIQITATRVKKGKRSEDLFPTSALERTMSDRVHCTQAQGARSSTLHVDPHQMRCPSHHQGIEVDKAKVDLISNLPSPRTVKEIRSFLGHAGFYRRFIRDFSKIARPLCKLLAKETSFVFD
jgi:hypothetical protein